MHNIIKFLVLSFLPLLSQNAWSNELNSNNILDLFPICEIPSSLGQKCKYEFAETKADSFLQVCCSDGANVEYKGNSVSVLSSGNWLYKFDISSNSDGTYQVIFTDEAMNGGTYYTLTEFNGQILEGKLLLKQGKSNKF